MRWLLGFAIAGAFLFALTRVRSYAASRGWVYARGEAPKRGNVTGGLGFEQVFEPEYTHVYEEQQSEEARADHAAVGDDDARP